jgi:hypothetical protein
MTGVVPPPYKGISRKFLLRCHAGCFTVGSSVATQRKPFLTHAGELARRLTRSRGSCAPTPNGTAATACYDPARLPELTSVIGREALLVMAADVRRFLPQAFSPARRESSALGNSADLMENAMGKSIQANAIV